MSGSIVEEYDFDIIGTQEIVKDHKDYLGYDQLNDLLQLIPQYEFIGRSAIKESVSSGTN
ncbi:MAG: hypothetical protein ACTH6S_00765 [Mesonia sp.]|uniref:hypothetical protein n=1 Tax=Mesonia sp. TaxID=1960830 RepID=UPI003F95A06C